MKFLSNEIKVSEMEQWIYDKEFLLELGNKTYEFFVSLDFHSIFTEKDIEDYIINLYEESFVDLTKERITWIVSGMANGTYDPILGCAILANLRSFGKDAEYIPILYVGYDSELEDIDRRYNTLLIEEKNEKERLFKLYKEEILNLSINFLNKLSGNFNEGINIS